MSTQTERMKQAINQLRNSTHEDPRSTDQILQLQRQVDKLNSEKTSIEQTYEKQILDLKNSVRESRRTDTSKVSREE